jgi:hypothetical protein
MHPQHQFGSVDTLRLTPTLRAGVFLWTDESRDSDTAETVLQPIIRMSSPAAGEETAAVPTLPKWRPYHQRWLS